MAMKQMNQYAGYHPFRDEDKQAYGSFEVFWNHYQPTETEVEYGWFWWPCFPGCIPDGEATGPFDSSYKAYLDAMETGK